MLAPVEMVRTAAARDGPGYRGRVDEQGSVVVMGPRAGIGAVQGSAGTGIDGEQAGVGDGVEETLGWLPESGSCRRIYW